MNNTAGLSPSDFSFGPASDDRAFDFSLTFEESILSVVPSALLLLLAPFRLILLQKEPNRVGGKGFQFLKLTTTLLFAAIQLALLVLFSVQIRWQTKTSIAAAVLSFLDAPIFCLLSYVEHARSIRPSTILGVYLFFSMVFDAVRLRTMWLVQYSITIRAMFTTSLAIKAILLVLEAKEKRRYLNNTDRKRSPEETSSVFSQSVFWWLNTLFLTGFRGVLSLDDLYPIDEEMSSEHLAESFARTWALSKPSKYRVPKVIIRMFTWQTFFPVLPRLALVAFTFCQPLLINRFLEYLQSPDESANIGYGLIGAYGVVYFGLAISTGFYWHGVYRWLALVRGALVSAIYKKTTEISITALDNSAAVTLMSTDIERIMFGLTNLHELWANVVQVGLSTWLLQRELGLASIAPVIVAVASAVGIILYSSNAGKYQKAWVEKIQTRIGVTSTMISSMKGVKMSGLTDRLTEHVQYLRIQELIAGTNYRMMQIYTVIIAFIPVQLSPVLTFGVFIAIYNEQGRVLDTTRMFTSLSLILLLAQPLSQVFQTVSQVVAAAACIDRIQKFLEAEPRGDHRLLDAPRSTLDLSPPSNVAGRYGRLRVPDEIELVTVKAPSKATIMPISDQRAVIRVIDGAFGWTQDEEPILKSINFEIQPGSLTIVVGPVASGKTTLLKALLGETPSSKGFVHVFTVDFSFCDQTPWLLSQTIQKNVIGFAPFDSAWYHTVIHVSCLADDIALFPNGHDTLVGSNGISLSGGQKQRLAIARAVYARKEVALFDDVFSGLDKTTEKKVFDRLFGVHGVLRKLGTTAIIATHAVNLLPSADQIIALDSTGKIVEQGTFADLNARGGYISGFALSARNSDEGNPEDESVVAPIVKQSQISTDELADKSRQTGDLSVYMYYCNAAGRVTFSLFLLYSAAFSFLATFPTVWLKLWSDAVNDGHDDLGKWLGGYAALQICGLLSLFAIGIQCFNIMTKKAGIKLHMTTLQTVMAAPMSFFSTTDTGVTLNRFSQDMQLLDTELSQAMLNFFGGVLTIIAQAALIASSSAYVAASYPVILGVFFAVQKFYLRTSRQLRFMDIEAKSPLYTQFLESLSGLATLRAFGWQRDNVKLNNQLLDDSQRPFYLLYMIQRWLTLVVDLIGMGLALLVVGLAVSQRSSVSPGFTGVSLVNIISFTEQLKWTIIHYTALETSIGAVSRVKNFEANTISEHLPIEDTPPPKDWPSQGLLKIEHMTASYKDDKPVLKNITLTIQPGEKIGICGRSGSGKSSLILALFRMIEIQSGSISIDNINLQRCPRSSIRSQINAIPQDPYFLHGTIRANLDPWNAQIDADLEASLRKVELWETIQRRGGLDAELDVDFLSHGQRQLFCLARAILRPGRIVVLDEVTSSVDRKTDALMQRVIREEFAQHTIIAVAHRLETILDFDRILVLDKGTVVECDNPAELLGRQSVFRDLYESNERRDTGSGSGETSNVASMAEDAAS